MTEATATARRIGVPANLRRSLVVLALGLGFGAVLTGMLLMITSNGWYPQDANTYRAAAERLNDGHFLYRLLPGDRPMTFNPPYWTVPLLSPPPVAVAWRPLALLGDASLYLWWIGSTISIFTALILLARRRPLATGLAVLALCLPFTLELGWSNVDGYFLLAMLVIWLAARNGRAVVVGALIATMIAIKLTPLPLALWLLITGQRRAFAATLAAGLAWAAISVAGAGLPAHFEYLDVIRNTLGAGTTDISLAGIGRQLGLSHGAAALLPFIWWAICVTTMIVMRRQPGAAWIAAVLMQVLGSPSVQVYSVILLLPALAPGAWPWPRSTPAAGATGAEDDTSALVSAAA